ncbi:MAG TPA: phosphomethylpyrimidine synthase ThiC, partial [Dokdonella sp.]
MNALPSELLRQAAELSGSVTRPIPGSRKIHVEGSRPDLRVPMREIQLADTPSMFGAEKNAPFAVYDTSGPYTDPGYRVDLAAGLPALRERWIEERGDSERLADFTSPFTRRHALAPSLAEVRFPSIPKPRVARSGMNVTQMHYARRGI